MNLTKTYLKNREFRVLRTIRGLSIEDIPTMRKDLQAQTDNIPGAIMTETDTAFEFNNGQFVMKPKQNKETIGQLMCLSSYMMFNNCRIEYKDITIEAKFWQFTTNNAIYKLNV